MGAFVVLTEIVIGWAAEDCRIMLKGSLAPAAAKLASIPVFCEFGPESSR